MNTDVSKEELAKIWDKRFSTEEINENSIFKNKIDWWDKAHKTVVDKYLEKIDTNSSVLEAGCGLGQWVFYCYRKGFCSVGADIAKTTLDNLNSYLSAKKIDTSKIKFVEDDIRKIKNLENDSFNLILSFGVLEHFKNNTAVLEEFHKIMKKGGYAIITVPNLYSISTITEPIAKLLRLWTIGLQKHYTRAELRKQVPLDKFLIIEEGTLITGQLFGSFAVFIPFIGKKILILLNKLSIKIESRSNYFGFMRFIVIQKI